MTFKSYISILVLQLFHVSTDRVGLVGRDPQTSSTNGDFGSNRGNLFFFTDQDINKVSPSGESEARSGSPRGGRGE